MFLVQHNVYGRLSLTGRDRTALIHRMSTNELNKLQVGQAALTVLTTPIGRIIDLLTVLNMGEEALVITGAGRGEQIRNYFQRNIFFNDQVKVADVSTKTQLFGLYGEDVQTDLNLHEFSEKDGVYSLRVDGGLWFWGEAEAMSNWETQVLNQGVPLATESEFEAWRIEKGLPSVAGELTEEYIPLEAGLWHAVSFSKGCYTGQEIIARMESRGKLAKMLVCLSAEQMISSGTDLLLDDSKVGNLTSVAQQNGHWLGLGYIKSQAVELGATLTTSDGQTVVIEKIAGTQRSE